MSFFKLLGIGSPLVDYSLEVSEFFLKKHVPGGKGCTRNISSDARDAILGNSSNIHKTPGGSAANTVRALAQLGGCAALFGKTGNDNDGKFFRECLKNDGADDSLLITDYRNNTGYCLSLITPDAERTMLSNLGASTAISTDEVKSILPFFNCSCILIEGYLIGEAWIKHFLEYAEENNISIAIDLNNPELVSANRGYFRDIVDNHVDILFANGEEIKALFDSSTVEQACRQLNIPTAIIKLGGKGSLLMTSSDRQQNITSIPPEYVSAVKDTTGAGDFYAAGFFYGKSINLPLEQCCRIGTLCAAAVIQQTGTILNENQWNQLKINIKNEVYE